MKVTIQKNCDVTIRIKKDDIKHWREIVSQYLDAYVDPDDIGILTEQEKMMLELDSKLARSIKKIMRLAKRKNSSKEQAQTLIARLFLR